MAFVLATLLAIAIECLNHTARCPNTLMSKIWLYHDSHFPSSWLPIPLGLAEQYRTCEKGLAGYRYQVAEPVAAIVFQRSEQIKAL